MKYSSDTAAAIDYKYATRTSSHYVFIDDLCGSGTQAREYYRDIVAPLKLRDQNARAHYLVLFATNEGLKHVRRHAPFDNVNTVFELDESFKAFAANSRYFKGCPTEIHKNRALGDVFALRQKDLYTPPAWV